MANFVKNDIHPVLTGTKYKFGESTNVRYAESAKTSHEGVKYVYVIFNSKYGKR